MRNLRPAGTSSSRQLGLAAAAIAAAAAATAISTHAYAQAIPTPVSWVAGTGDYNTGANWSSGTTPSNAANEYLMINNGGTAQVTAGGEGAFLILGNQPGDAGSLTITGGTLTLGEFRVGGRDNLIDPSTGATTPNAGGSGAVSQTGGTVNVTYNPPTGEPPVVSFYVGNGGLDTPNSASGTYSISNNAALNVGVLLNDQISIGTGTGSHATFSQSGTSSVSSAGNVQIGRRGATGTYLMSGGTLTTGTGTASGTITTGGDLYIGNGDDVSTVSGSLGSFVQTGGDVNSKLTTVVGRDRGTGFYSITGGSLTAQTNLNVGVGGVGTFVQGDTVSHPNVPVVSKFSLTVGLNGTTVGGTGTYTLNSGTLSVGTGTGDVLAIGNNNGGAAGANSSGLFTQNGGSVTTTGDVQLGRNNSTGPNAYDMHAGSLSVGRDLLVGGGNSQTGGTGTFSQADGTTVSITRNLNIGLGGSGSAANGTYNLNGGTLSLPAAGAVLAIGNNGTGTLTQTGGTLTATGATSTIDVGRAGTNTGVGTYNLSGGVLNTTQLRANASTSNQVNFSGGSSTIGTLNLNAGTMTVSGGTHTVSNTFSTGTSTLFISGGTFNFPTQLNANSGGTIRTAIDQTIPSAVSIGNFTFQVDSNTLSVTGNITSPSGGRTITKTGAGTLALSGAWTYNTTTSSPNNNSTIAANAGTTNVNVDLNGPTATTSMTVNAASGATVNFGTSQHINNLTASGTVTLTPGGSKSLNTGSLSIPAGGTVDLTNNALSVTAANTPLPTVLSYLSSAFNNGAWNQPGLTSSTAAATNRAYGLAYSSDATNITVQYARMGDLNLDGTINGDDYTAIDRLVANSGFGSAATWSTGDVNYDGLVTQNDYLVMDIGYGRQQGTLSPDFLADRDSRFGDAYVAQLVAAVPEPTSLAACGFALLPLLRRRRSR